MHALLQFDDKSWQIRSIFAFLQQIWAYDGLVYIDQREFYYFKNFIPSS